MPVDDAIPPGTEAALTKAYLTLKTSKEAPGKKEQVFDKLGPCILVYIPGHILLDFSAFEGNIIISDSESPTLIYLGKFYTANSAVINSAAAGLGSLDNKTIDAAISGFSESVKVVMNGLDALGQVHPFIGGTDTFSSAQRRS
jgi:hypothetical protein